MGAGFILPLIPWILFSCTLVKGGQERNRILKKKQTFLQFVVIISFYEINSTENCDLTNWDLKLEKPFYSLYYYL